MATTFAATTRDALTSTLAAVTGRLGLAQDSTGVDVLNALDALLARSTGATTVVNDAVSGGRIPATQREFWLRAARNDLTAANLVMNSQPPGRFDPLTSAKPTEAQIANICAQLGISREQYDGGASSLPEAASRPD